MALKRLDRVAIEIPSFYGVSVGDVEPFHQNSIWSLFDEKGFVIKNLGETHFSLSAALAIAVCVSEEDKKMVIVRWQESPDCRVSPPDLRS